MPLCGTKRTYYRQAETLGRGHFAEVVRIVAPDGGERARKILHSTSAFRKEWVLCQALRRRASAGDGTGLLLLLEAHPPLRALDFQLAAKGELFDQCVQSPGRLRLPQMCQLVRAVQALRSLRIAHCDLKPENVLVMADDTIRVGDFGLSVLLETLDERFPHVEGTAFYCAPEALTPGDMDAGSDLWSLGIVLFIMGSGFNPHDLFGPMPVAEFKAMRRSDDTNFWSTLTAAAPEWDTPLWTQESGFAEAVRGLLQYDSTLRWTPTEVGAVLEDGVVL